MSLLNPLILYGLALAAIPVVLHFLMRSKPRPLPFPALRLIQIRRKTNTRRLRLRHLWLLLLRVGVILLLVLAIARPLLPPANYGLTLREGLTLAALAVGLLAVYGVVVNLWRRRRIPNHAYAYRRTLLRSGLGVAGLLLFLLLVAWPYWNRIEAELTDPRPEVFQNVPVSAIFVFDTSPSMDYQMAGQTRLQAAQKVAGRFLKDLPAQSRVAVTDTTTEAAILFQSDPAGVQSRIDTLAVRPASQPLNERLRAAAAAHEKDREQTLGSQAALPEDQRQDRFIREIYVFTDMAASQWQDSVGPQLREELARMPRVRVYLIDTGVEQPTNVALSPVELPAQTVPAGSDLAVRTTLRAIGVEAGERTVELSVRGPGGERIPQGKRTVKLGAGAEELEFPLSGLHGPVTQGEVRLVSSDPLAADDVRFFTVAVARPPKILIVADRRADQFDLHDALAPETLEALGKARYQVEFLPSDQFRGAALEKLNQYDVVSLVNVAEPSENAWRALEEYVRRGGGLFVVMGDMNGERQQLRAQIAYSSEAARAVLPISGEEMPAPRQPFRPPASLNLPDLSHPVLQKFEEYRAFGGAGQLASAPVYRAWAVQPADGATVIARYTDALETPALIEGHHGEGRVVLLTTGLDLKGWAELPRADWNFLLLADQLMQYLGQQAESVYNYLAGDDVAVPLDPEHPVRKYLLRKPGLEQVAGEVPVDPGAVVVRQADQVGHYEIRGADEASRFHTGFSVNVPPGESDFTRVTKEQLDELLGEDRYGRGRSTEDLEKIVGNDRIPVEVFPNVLALVIVAFILEHFVANRFYEAEQEPARM